MSSAIKGLVSKKRRRYKQDGFDLDLTYISNNLIAMGYPGEQLEGFYRNNIEDVSKFFETKHRNRYKLYNLCSERSYDKNKFRTGSVAYFPFEDHNPPSLNIIPQFCADVQMWLSSHPENVAAVHCKAGKGRTGVMVCCYMLHCGAQRTAADALAFYANKRTHDRKGVTIPSQKRYVEYYEILLRKGVGYSQRPVQLSSIKISGNLNLAGTYTLSFTLYNPVNGYHVSGAVDWRKLSQSTGVLKLQLEKYLPLSGDVRVDIYAKYIMRKEKICRFWFNTFFIENVRIDDGTTPKATIRFNPQEPSQANHPRDRDLDRTMSCPPPVDSARPAIPEQWTRWDSTHRLPTPAARNNTEQTYMSSTTPTLSLKLEKAQLDKAVKDKQDKITPSNFTVELEFCEHVLENNKNGGTWTRSNSENNGHVHGSISSSDSESDESSSSSVEKNFREPD